MSVQNDAGVGTGRATFIVVTASLAGLIVGAAIEALSKRRGRGSVAERWLKVADHALRGFALGSLTASTFFKIARDEDNNTTEE